MDMIRKTFQIEVKKEDVNEDASTLLAAVSSERRDRDGEIIRISESSVDLEGYRKNPVLLWQHRSDDPIGRAQWIKVHEKKLLAKFEFHRKTQRSIEIFELYKSGFLNSFSIGFRPTVPRNDAKVFRKIEVFEISAVSVPSNIDAIVQNGYSQKITDGILRKDLNLESSEAPIFNPEIFAHALKEALDPEAMRSMVGDGIRQELGILKGKVDKIVTVEKEDRLIEVDIEKVEKMVFDNLLEWATENDVEMAKRMIKTNVKKWKDVELGKLMGKVF